MLYHDLCVDYDQKVCRTARKVPIAAAKQFRKIRPIFFAVENVEGFIRHPHSTVIIKLFKWAGYKMLWNQVRDAKDFWLAVFLRHDISCEETFGSFRNHRLARGIARLLIFQYREKNLSWMFVCVPSMVTSPCFPKASHTY